jgi:hypothetical protein
MRRRFDSPSTAASSPSPQKTHATATFMNNAG